MEAVTRKLDLIFCELQSLTQAVKAIVLQTNDAAVNARCTTFLDPVSDRGARRSECTEVKNAIDSIVRATGCERREARTRLNERLHPEHIHRFEGEGGRRSYLTKEDRDLLVPLVIDEMTNKA